MVTAMSSDVVHSSRDRKEENFEGSANFVRIAI